MTANGEAKKKSVVTLEWDHESFTLAVRSSEMTVGFCQMMLDEAARFMEDQRRKAVIADVKRQLDEQRVSDTFRRTILQVGGRND